MDNEETLTSGFRTARSQELWKQGIISPWTSKIPTMLKPELMEAEERKHLAKQVKKFGKGAAGALMTHADSKGGIPQQCILNARLGNSSIIMGLLVIACHVHQVNLAQPKAVLIAKIVQRGSFRHSQKKFNAIHALTGMFQ